MFYNSSKLINDLSKDYLRVGLGIGERAADDEKPSDLMMLLVAPSGSKY